MHKIKNTPRNAALYLSGSVLVWAVVERLT